MQNATTMNRGDASRARRFPRGARVTVEALARVFRPPGLRLDPEQPSRPHGHEFRAPPGVWVVWG